MQSPRPPRKPEIMSPAGYWPQLRAAIEAGADSVYFGLKHFTARAKAGFSLSELPEVMKTLHRRGVRGFVTFNTLVFDYELEEAAQALAAIARSGADAIIIQDPGIVKLARTMAPSLEIHASTQMSITDADGVRLAQNLGVDRVTLARELSLAEIRAIRAQTDCELEIFVHGALCVAYSGQCLSSEAWGGRSANRGQCAQACRLPYEMVVDGETRDLGDSRYLLSPGDLQALHHIPEIVDIGIAALKIEGRYKEADYVALTTSAYRKAVDEAWAGVSSSITRRDEIALEQVYSRGLGPFFISGTNHQTVVQGRAPRHRGVQMGRVARVLEEAVLIEPTSANEVSPLAAGQGVVFDAADWRSPEEPEEGGRIFEVTPVSNSRIEIRFGRNALNYSRIRVGDLLWRTHDPELDKAVRPYLEASAPVQRQPVHVDVTAVEGAPLRSVWWLANRPEVRAETNSAAPLGHADRRPIDTTVLRDQLGRLGGTAYELVDLHLKVEGSPFAPVSMLNVLRRDAIERLSALQSELPSTPIGDPAEALRSVRPPVLPALPARESHLHLLVRTAEQLDAAISVRPASITLDYLDLYGLKPSVDRVRQADIPIRIATPRVLKPGEERIAEFLLKLGAPILVRPAGLLHCLEGRAHPPLTGDFSLNAANAISASLYLRSGLERLTPAYDLNADQVAELARAVGPHLMESVVYQHLPVFHTEHCVFCRFQSTGTSYKDCGRPCEKHQLEIRDWNGRSHPVIADVGCRNTVFGAQAQEASQHLELWRKAGIRHFRVEFAHETGEQVSKIAHAFEAVLAGRKNAQQLNAYLRQFSPQGSTEGSYFVPANYKSLPVLQ